jgi:hypothetical protein
MTYYAEKEPPDDGAKVHRLLPMPKELNHSASVDADAVYWGDWTALKIPDLRWVTIYCVCKDGRWSFEVAKGGVPVRPFIEWPANQVNEPEGWPNRGAGPINVPHYGSDTLTKPPLQPLNPVQHDHNLSPDSE